MKFILIILVGWTGQGVTTQEFGDKKACLNAKMAVEYMHQEQHGGYYLSAMCVPYKDMKLKK